MAPPCVLSRRASSQVGSAIGATSTRSHKPKLRMARAVAPMLAAISGRTRTTRQLLSAMAVSRLDNRQRHVFEPLQVQLARPERGQLGHLMEIALIGNPEIGEPLLAEA